MAKPALSFGQACYIVSETERSLKESGIPLHRYSALRSDRDIYERLKRNNNESPDYTIENGGQLSLMDDFFKFLPSGGNTRRIKSLDVLKLRIDDVGNALRKIEFDGLLTPKVKQHVKTIGFFDLYEGKTEIFNPSIHQWANDMCNSRARRTRLRGASAMHTLARNLKP